MRAGMATASVVASLGIACTSGEAGAPAESSGGGGGNEQGSSTSTSGAGGFARNPLLLAVGNQTVYTSDDAFTWTEQLKGVAGLLRDVAYGAGTYVAVGLENATLHSHDGTDWSEGGTVYGNDLYSVAFGNGRFVAVGQRMSAAFSSTDGANWEEGPDLAAGGTGRRVKFGNGVFVAEGFAGSANMNVSSDGISWALASVPGPVEPSPGTLSFVNSRFVVAMRDDAAVPQDAFAWSTDGETWSSSAAQFGSVPEGCTARLPDGFFSNSGFEGPRDTVPLPVLYESGSYVALFQLNHANSLSCVELGVETSAKQYFLGSSSDLINWTYGGLEPSFINIRVASWNLFEGALVAVGKGGRIVSRIGGNWFSDSTQSAQDLFAVGF